MKGDDCVVEYVLDSSISVMETHQACNDSFTLIKRDAISKAWGTPWGMPLLFDQIKDPF